MSKIVSVFIDNINGVNGTFELSGKDVIIGDNGAGKSTLLKAIRLARLGRDPDERVGAQAISIRQLASGESMTAGLVTATDDGRLFTINRTFTERAGKGSQKVRLSPCRGEKTKGEIKDRLDAELGDFDIMFDPDQFNDLSGPAKRDFIFQVCGADVNISKEEIGQRLQPPPPEGEDEEDPDFREAWDKWKQNLMQNWDSNFSFFDNFNNLLAYLKASVSHLKAERDGSEKAAQKLVELKNTYGDDAGRFNLTELAEKISTAEKTIRGAGEEAATVQERNNTIELFEREIEIVRGKLDNLGPPPEGNFNSTRLAELPELMNAAEEAHANYKIGLRDKIEEIERKIDRLTQETIRAEIQEKSIKELDGSIAGRKELCDRNPEMTQEHRKRQIAVPSKLTEERKKLATHQARLSVFGVCGVGRDDCEWLKRNCSEEEKKKLTQIIKLAESTVEILEGELVTLDRRALLDKNGVVFRQDLAGLEKKRAEIGEIDVESLLLQKGTLEDQLAGLLKDQEKDTEFIIIKKEWEELSAMSSQIEKREFFTAQLQSKQNALNSLGKVANLSILEKKKQGLESQITQFKEDRKKKVEAKTAWTQAENAAFMREQFDIELKAVGVMREKVGPKGIQGAIVRDLMKPLSSRINDLLGIEDAVFDFLMEDEKGTEIFKLGFSKDGKFVSIPSGGEEILFYAAFFTALVIEKNPRNKTLLFELAEASPLNLHRFFNRLGEYVDKGLLDNVVAAYCHFDLNLEAIITSGWNVHYMKDRKELPPDQIKAEIDRINQAILALADGGETTKAEGGGDE